jgi:ABC-type glycerol-3-phosphate transport system permease component
MKAGRGLFLMVLILGAVGPLYLLLKVSVSPPAEVMTPHPLLLPHAVTWRFWERVLASGQIAAPLWKSLGVASGVALLALIFAGPAAYSLAQLPVRWRYGVLLSLLLCRMLPEVSVALPVAVVFLRWGLLDTALGLILAHLTMALPVAAWVLTTTFSSIPREVEEAAAVDGCGAWRTLISIILPLALPGLAVWTRLAVVPGRVTLATYLTLGAKTMPLQVYYYLYQGNWFDTAVAATLMTSRCWS